MQKIQIEFKENILKVSLVTKERNIDNTMLNTNIISNEKLLFSLDYILNNIKLVSNFLKEICQEKKTDTIVCNNMSVIESFSLCFKNIPINKIIMNTNDNFTYKAYENTKEILNLKEIEVNSIPNYLVELYDKENIKVSSKQEVLFSSQFMANNDFNNYSSIFYAKNIKLGCPIVSNDLNDLTVFFKINKYLKTIELYHYISFDLENLINLVISMRLRNITIEIHDNITDEEEILHIKQLKNTNKKNHINIELVYSKEYIQNNYVKQLISTTIKSCFIIVIILCGLSFAFVFLTNKESEDKVLEISNNIDKYLEENVKQEENPTDELVEPSEEPSTENPSTEEPSIEEPNTPVQTKLNPVISALKDLNADTVGWLDVPGTSIDYPVVKTVDNSYYLKHNFNKEYDRTGWVFMNYLNTSGSTLDQNTIIFAHNRYYSNVMFGTLNKTGKKEWYSNVKNNLITYTDLYNEYYFEVFSIYTIDVTDDYLITNFSSTESFQDFITMIRKRSIFTSDLTINDDDNILTLSTCADINTRFVVHAVLRKDLTKNAS